MKPIGLYRPFSEHMGNMYKEHCIRHLSRDSARKHLSAEPGGSRRVAHLCRFHGSAKCASVTALMHVFDTNVTRIFCNCRNPDDVALISELVGILHTMVKCGDLEISNQAMNDIHAENGMDVFEMLLEVHGMNMLRAFLVRRRRTWQKELLHVS